MFYFNIKCKKERKGVSTLDIVPFKGLLYFYMRICILKKGKYPCIKFKQKEPKTKYYDDGIEVPLVAAKAKAG